MTDKVAIFLTVLASSCLGMYFYYNEQGSDLIEVNDSNDLIERQEEDHSTHETDVHFGKKIYHANNANHVNNVNHVNHVNNVKSKRNKRITMKKSSRKSY